MAVKSVRIHGLRARAVEVHIEQLVLEGVAPSERHRVSEAVQRELSRLLGASGGLPSVWERGARLERIDAGAMAVGEPGPQATGVRIARAVHRGLRR